MDSTTVLGIANIIVTLGLVGLTAWYAISTRELVEASRPIPSVIIDIEFQNRDMMCVVIKNVGNAVAKDISMRCVSNIVNTRGDRLADFNAFKRGIPYLSPGSELSLYFDLALAFYHRKELEKSWVIDVSYSDMSSRSYGPHRFDIDISVYDDLLSDTDHLEVIAEELRQMKFFLQRLIGDGSSRPTGVRVVTSADIREWRRQVSPVEERSEESPGDSSDESAATPEAGNDNVT